MLHNDIDFTLKYFIHLLILFIVMKIIKLMNGQK